MCAHMYIRISLAIISAQKSLNLGEKIHIIVPTYQLRFCHSCFYIVLKPVVAELLLFSEIMLKVRS